MLLENLEDALLKSMGFISGSELFCLKELPLAAGDRRAQLGSQISRSLVRVT